MKKTTLLVLGLAPIIGLTQKSVQKVLPSSSIKAAHALKLEKKYYTGFETIVGSADQSSRSFTEDIIGNTLYDLQTNSSNQRRIVNHGDGTLSASFTYGEQTTGFYPDRGAGYNYFDGSSWGPNATSRIETTRNGWPSISTSGGNEIIVSHSGTGGLTLNIRATKGTGAWVESVIPTNTGSDILWPRVAIGGNTIHVIGVVNDTTGIIPGLDNAVAYYRSKDLGLTWDIVDSILPGLDSTKYNFHGGDTYSIDASGSTVALAVFPSWGDLTVLKSVDNGDTWTTFIANDMIDKYQTDSGFDLDSNGVHDSVALFTTDGSGSVLLDKSDMVHVYFGGSYVFDDDHTDGGTFFLPLTGQLGYWNETYGNDNVSVIARYKDNNGDGLVDSTLFLHGGSAADLPQYRVNGVSMPSSGISASGALYVTYASLSETHDNGATSNRHIYVIKSTDGGATWSDPVDYTPDFGFNLSENVYPSMAKLVDDNVHIVFQRDFVTGTEIVDENGTPSFNDIVYLKVDTALIPPVDPNAPGIEEQSFASLNLYPNPTNDELYLSLTDNSFVGQLTVSITDITGRTVYTSTNRASNTRELINLNVSDLNNGAYNLVVNANNSIISKTFIKQ